MAQLLRHLDGIAELGSGDGAAGGKQVSATCRSAGVIFHPDAGEVFAWV